MKRLLLALSALALASGPAAVAQTEILNASFDISRELFADVNREFSSHWKEKTGRDVTVRQSHGGSSRQALAIREGLQADVVTFNQVNDVLTLVDARLVDRDWQSRFPHNASPYYSVHSIVVRAGNPRGIRDWADLAKPGVTIVQVNPKTGGNGRYAVLAYYAAGLRLHNGDEAKARDFLKAVLANVVVFENGGRGATTTFTERGIGDVLVTFESETLALGARPEFEPVTPSLSIQSEFPVAVVTRVAARRGTADLAKAYLDFLYTPQGQEVIARNFYRPHDAAVAARHAATLPPVQTLQVDDVFGGWPAATAKFFANGALVDQLLREIAAERRSR